MEQNLGLLYFFERRPKAGNQRVRQVPDKADRVAEQHAAAAWQFDPSQLGIERGEHARRLQHLCTSHPIEQRAFARIGVADQRHRGHRYSLAALALLAPNTLYRIEIEFDLVDAPLNLAAIGFELCFTGSAGADTTAELRHEFAAAGQSRQHVFELSQFHLQLALTGSRMPGKDVENKLSSIEHAAR